MRVLIIEDEPKTAFYIRKGLTEQGLTVDIANNGEDGLFYAISETYSIIIVDIMLPKMNGWLVVKGIRDYNSTIPILILTARDEIEEKVKGLDLGADDYLVKPFTFSELLARVRSLLRRGHLQQNSHFLQVADLSINLLKCHVKRNQQHINLTAQEFKLLSLLMQRKGEVLSRTILAEQVWGMHFNSETNVVDVAVRRLRQKIDADYKIKLIHSVRGMGYILDERHED